MIIQILSIVWFFFVQTQFEATSSGFIQFRFNPSSPNGDENEISLYIIITCSNIQVMRIKEVITKD